MKLIQLVFLSFLSAQLFSQWEPTKGPSLTSENISFDLEHIAGNGDRVAAIVDGFGSPLSISVNDGFNWHHMTADIQDENLLCLDFRDSTIILGMWNSTVLISTDYGNNFEILGNGLPESGAVMNIAFTTTGIVLSHYVDSSADQLLYYYDENMDSWVESSGLIPTRIYAISQNESTLYVGCNEGVYKSLDQGVTWVYSGLENVNVATIHVDEDRVFACGNTTAADIFASTNGGDTWIDISSNAPSPFIKDFETLDNLVFGTFSSEGIYYSVNNGIDWEPTEEPDCFQNESLYFHGDTLFSTCNFDGSSVSYDMGDSWLRHTPSIGLEIFDMAISGNNIVTVTNDGIHVSPDQGESWIRDFFSANCIVANGNELWLGRSYGLRRSSDNGLTWSNHNLSGFNPQPNFTDLVSSDSLLVAGTTEDGVLLSLDFGENWSAIGESLPEFSIAAVAIKDSIIYASVDSAGMFTSFDFGETWTLSSFGIGSQFISSIAVAGDELYAGTMDNGLFRSSNLGFSWTQMEVSNSPADTSIQTVFTNGCEVFVAIGRSGILKSSDCGNTWNKNNDGLVNRDILSMCHDADNLYLGTNGGGVWKHSNQLLNGLEEFNALSLERIEVYPNPTSEYITCTSRSKIQVVNLFDLSGRKLSIPIHRLNHKELQLDLSALNPAIYLLTLQPTADTAPETFRITVE